MNKVASHTFKGSFKNVFQYIVFIFFLSIALSSFWAWKQSSGAPPTYMDSGTYLRDGKIAAQLFSREGPLEFARHSWLGPRPFRPVLTSIFASLGFLTISEDLFDMTMSFNCLTLILIFVAVYWLSRQHVSESKSLLIATLLCLSPWIYGASQSFMSELSFSLFSILAVGFLLSPQFSSSRKFYWGFYVFSGLAMACRPTEGAATLGILCGLEALGFFQNKTRLLSVTATLPSLILVGMILFSFKVNYETEDARLIYMGSFCGISGLSYLIQKLFRLPISAGLNAMSFALGLFYMPGAQNLANWTVWNIVGGGLDPLDLKSNMTRTGLAFDLLKDAGLFFDLAFLTGTIILLRTINHDQTTRRFKAAFAACLVFPILGVVQKNFDQRYYHINFVLLLIFAFILIDLRLLQTPQKWGKAWITTAALSAGICLYGFYNLPQNMMTSPRLLVLAGHSNLSHLPVPRPKTDFFKKLVQMFPDKSRVQVPWVCPDRPFIDHDWFNILTLDEKKDIHFDSPYPGGDVSKEKIVGKYDFLIHSPEICQDSPASLIREINENCPNGKCPRNFWLSYFDQIEFDTLGQKKTFIVFKVDKDVN